MVDAAPFRALRYDAAVAGPPVATSAPAYDELDRFDLARHRTAGPYTVLQLLAPEGGPGSPEGYAAAGAAYRRWCRTGVLVADALPGVAVYDLAEPADRGPGGGLGGGSGAPVRVTRGLLAAVRVGTGARSADLLGHEQVDPARIRARLARLAAVPADLAPVLAVADLPQQLRGRLERIAAGAPDLELVDEAGVAHRLWTRTDPVEIDELRSLLAPVHGILADGHHRYAAAAELARRGGDDRTLAYLVDGHRHGPRVLPVHRLLPRVPPDVPARLTADFELVPAPADPEALRVALDRSPEGVVALRLPGRAVLLRPRDLDGLRARMPAGTSPRWRALDTALVEQAVLPRLGVRASDVAYRVGAAATIEAEVDGLSGALVMVRPVDLGTVQELAKAGERMPAKSTSFTPKPRAGLVLRPLHESHDHPS